MDILNIGSLNIDYVYQVEHFVSPGETLLANNLFLNCGGKGLNQSIAAARAGSKVYHAGLVGNDGEKLLHQLSSNKVDINYVKQVKDQGGHAIIQINKEGQNCILLYGGTNQCLTKEYIDQVLDCFGNQGMVLLQNEMNLISYIIEKASEKGLLVALNAAPMNRAVLDYPIQKLAWLIINEIEGRELAECDKDTEILPKLAEKYPNCNLLLTLGSQGACCYSNGSIYRIGSHRVDVVDTTAAGDTFTGYFLSAINNNESIGDSLLFATTASALCVRRKGASDSIPLKYEVDEILKNNEFSRLEIKYETFTVQTPVR